MLKDLEDLEIIETAITASSYSGERKIVLRFAAQCLWGARNFAVERSSLGAFQQWTAEDIVRATLWSSR